jgi:hypothetical protein
MSLQPAPENVQASEHEHELVSGDDKGSYDGIERFVPISKVDKDNEPVVTRKELWSYYRKYWLIFCLYVASKPRRAVYYNGDNGVGPMVIFCRPFHLCLEN